MASKVRTVKSATTTIVGQLMLLQPIGFQYSDIKSTKQNARE